MLSGERCVIVTVNLITDTASAFCLGLYKRRAARVLSVAQVDQSSLAAIENVPFEPSFTRTDNSQPPIITTWLNNSIPFSIRVE